MGEFKKLDILRMNIEDEALSLLQRIDLIASIGLDARPNEQEPSMSHMTEALSTILSDTASFFKRYHEHMLESEAQDKAEWYDDRQERRRIT